VEIIGNWAFRGGESKIKRGVSAIGKGKAKNHNLPEPVSTRESGGRRETDGNCGGGGGSANAGKARTGWGLWGELKDDHLTTISGKKKSEMSQYYRGKFSGKNEFGSMQVIRTHRGMRKDKGEGY